MAQLPDALQPKALQQKLTSVFQSMGLTTVEAIKDDAAVAKAADLIYPKLPMVARGAIRATIGKDGFNRLLFEARDKIIEHQSLEGGNQPKVL